MDSSACMDDPHAEYSGRLKTLHLKKSTFERRHQLLGLSKMAVAFALLIVIGWAVRSRSVSIIWFIAPVLTLLLLEAVHLWVLRSLQTFSRTSAFYQRGIARLENRWMGTGEAGNRFLDTTHPYARDLDLFGSGSLFELLCTARTSVGQGILSDWLLHPATLEEIESRQGAITELRSQLDLREELAVFGEDVRSRVHPHALITWAEEPRVLKPRPAQIVAALLAALWISSLIVWGIWGLWQLTFVSGALNMFFNSRFKSRVGKIVYAEKFAPEFGLLAGVLARLEGEEFSSKKLISLQSALNEWGLPPSQCLSKMKRLGESLESRRNLLLSVLDPFILWTAQNAFAIEAWRQKFGAALRHWLSAVGEMEALASLASYAYEHPANIFPEFTTGGALFDATGLAHPLLPEGLAVPNDLKIGGEVRLFMISGPNMAGKSTFVRAVGINAVLAQCGAPVRAHALRLSLLQVTASICILDSLQGGVSRFYAEITRLKLIAELTNGPLPVLFLLDELLNGTNSHDRLAGAEAVVKNLVAKGAVGLVTTHDSALTLMVEEMKPQAVNMHFEDRLVNGELHFDYKLEPGIAKGSNALKLMRSIGLDV